MHPHVRHRHGVIDQLAAVELFSGCSRRQLARVDTLSTRIDVEPGRVLLRQGDNALEFFVILGGEAIVSIDHRALDCLGPGRFFGETDLLDRGPRRATVTAVTTMQLLVFSAVEFRALIGVAPGAAALITQKHVAHLRVAQASIAQLESRLAVVATANRSSSAAGALAHGSGQ